VETGTIEQGTIQGLTGSDLERFYHLDMGGEIIPLDWLKALQSSVTGKPFLENVERFGLWADPKSTDGLPIGLTASESRNSRLAGKMVGLNCAACHTAEITFQGRRLRIEGGAGMFNASAFAKELSESITATIGSKTRLFEFIGRLHSRAGEQSSGAAQSDASHLIGELQNSESLASAGAAEKAFVEYLEQIAEHEQNSPAIQQPSLSLKSRVEQTRQELQTRAGEVLRGDIATILEREAGKVLSRIEDRESAVRAVIEHVVEQVRLIKARVAFLKKMHALQNLPTTDPGPGRADDFATARNALFAEQFAIEATAPCSIPPLWNTADMTWTDWDGNTTSAMGRSMATALAGGASFDPDTFVSTVSPRNLFEFEQLVRKIQPPAWPAEMLGPIDRARADHGANLFREKCATCHPMDAGVPPDLLYDVAEIGTDPSRATNFTRPLGDRPFADALRDVIGKYMQQANHAHGITAEEAKEMEAGHPNQWRPTGKYASRPLHAVWATAPYLHNGSVPTLDDLLRPATQRPQSFRVGHTEFDPVKVGIAASADASSFVFDTSKTGNANTGHEYGADMNDSDRQAVIEFLKSR
jgi:mono/diheme cytochrome c family protein